MRDASWRAWLAHASYGAPLYVILFMLGFALVHGPVVAQAPAPSCPSVLAPDAFLPMAWQDALIGRAVGRFARANPGADSAAEHVHLRGRVWALLDELHRDQAWQYGLLDRTLQFAVKNAQGNICVRAPGTSMQICRSPAYWRAALEDLARRSVAARIAGG